jgi:tetratricopeptide (TPR) repeat protein
MRPFLLVALLVSLPVASRACLNDRDSDALAVQNNRFPDALRVISGRFERNPPRFYQMRIARVLTELKSKPRDFGLYDDLAVAHDKLGDDETALKIMAQKRALLPTFSAKDKANREAWYRFYANDGTFRAHRFLHDDAKIQNIGEMKQARSEIARALQIKPNAHFGREKYQLAVMDWIVAAKSHKTENSLADFLAQRFQYDSGYDIPRAALQNARKEAAQGLSGLIVLGAAWQSPDVFDALATALEARPTIALSYLARHRSQELLGSGAMLLPGSILPMVEFWLRDTREFGLNDTNTKTLDAFYPKVRAEADEWTRQRDGFMETKFAQNKHPDTDAHFWNGWKDSAPPSLDVAWFNERAATQRVINNSVLLFKSIVFGVPTLIIAALVWFRRRRIKRQTSLA